MHLVDNLVLRVRQRDKVGVGDVPSPGSGPRVALDPDVLLLCARCTDAVDGGLVELEDQVLGHGVVLVVGVKNNTGVVHELSGEVAPEGLEVGRVGDDVAEVAAVVVGVEHGVGAGVGDEVDGVGEVAEVTRVERVGQAVLRETLHGEADAEGVVALVNQCLYRLSATSPFHHVSKSFLP